MTGTSLDLGPRVQMILVLGRPPAFWVARLTKASISIEAIEEANGQKLWVLGAQIQGRKRMLLKMQVRNAGQTEFIARKPQLE